MIPILPIETVNVLLGASIAFVTAIIIESYRRWSRKKEFREALADEIGEIRSDLVFILDALYVQQVGEEVARPHTRYASLIPPNNPQEEPPYDISQSIYEIPGPENDVSFPHWMTEPQYSEVFKSMVRERIDAAINHHPVYDSNTATIGALPSSERKPVVRFFRTLDRASVEVDPINDRGQVKSWAYTCELRANEAIDKLQ